MTAMTLVFPTIKAPAEKVVEAFIRSLDPLGRYEPPNPVADMQVLWQLYLYTGNVRWCHAVSARSQLFEWECKVGRLPVQTLRPEDLLAFAELKEAAE